MSLKKTLTKFTYKNMIGGLGKGLGYTTKLAVRGATEAASAAAKVAGKNKTAEKIKKGGISTGETIQKGVTKVGETLGSGVQWCMEKVQDGAGTTARKIAEASGAKEETTKKVEMAVKIGTGAAIGIAAGTAGTDALIHALAAPGTAGAAAITSGTAALGGGSIASGGGGMVAGQAVAQGITASAATTGGIASAATELSKKTEERENLTFSTSDKKAFKGEIDSRLWLCDMWLKQLDEGKIQQFKALSAIVNEQLRVILDYREKYYGISAGEDRKILLGYLQTRNEAEIRTKLTEYKEWWRSNKRKAPAL